MKADAIVFVKESGEGDFEFQYDSRKYLVPKGKVVPMQFYLASHGMELANRALNRPPDAPPRLTLLDEEEGSVAALNSRAALAEEQALAAQEEAKKKVDEAARLKKEAQVAKAQAAAASGTDKKGDEKK